MTVVRLTASATPSSRRPNPTSLGEPCDLPPTGPTPPSFPPSVSHLMLLRHLTANLRTSLSAYAKSSSSSASVGGRGCQICSSICICGRGTDSLLSLDLKLNDSGTQWKPSRFVALPRLMFGASQCHRQQVLCGQLTPARVCVCVSTRVCVCVCVCVWCACPLYLRHIFMLVPLDAEEKFGQRLRVVELTLGAQPPHRVPLLR